MHFTFDTLSVKHDHDAYGDGQTYAQNDGDQIYDVPFSETSALNSPPPIRPKGAMHDGDAPPIQYDPEMYCKETSKYQLHY